MGRRRDRGREREREGEGDRELERERVCQGGLNGGIWGTDPALNSLGCSGGCGALRTTQTRLLLWGALQWGSRRLSLLKDEVCPQSFQHCPVPEVGVLPGQCLRLALWGSCPQCHSILGPGAFLLADTYHRGHCPALAHRSFSPHCKIGFLDAQGHPLPESRLLRNTHTSVEQHR